MRIAVAGGTGMVGQHVVACAQRAGHDTVVLSRSHGVDMRSGEGLSDALAGVDVVIDVVQPDTLEQGPAADFFTAVASSLQRCGAGRGVGHIVTLSIVGIDHTSFGYYRAKLAHEQAACSGPVPATVQRATQFHEFGPQLAGMTAHDGQAQVMDVAVQPVASRAVAEVLVELAEGAPVGPASDLAGPRREDLVALARRFVERFGVELVIRADTAAADAIPTGALLPGDRARIQGPSFEEWLDGEDAAVLAHHLQSSTGSTDRLS